MEIQGLSHAKNIHCQHGAPQRTGSSPHRTTTGARSLSISNENEAHEDLESHELQSDNNNRTRTSTFRLLAENGSVLCLPVCKQKGKNNSPYQTQTANVGLRNINTLKARELNAKLLPHDFFRTGYKYDIESGDKLLQMELPFFAGEEEQYQQQQLQPPVLRQQHEDCASLLQSLASESTTNANKNTDEYYVVFNIVQDDGNDADKYRLGNPSKNGDTISGNMKFEHYKINPCNSMEFQTTNAHIESDDNLNNLAAEALKQTVHLCSLLNSSSNSEGEATVTNEKPSVCYETGNENTALTNEYVENLCGHQVCIKNIESNAPDQLSSQTEAQDSSALISENTDIVEMSDAIDLISDAGRSLSANADGTPNSASANESFSGTIMINNQSIIVTIENGILTLAAPPEGYTHKDDGMVGLKEHLGMKDHKDIVLLNYDSGTKSIGKISNMVVIRAGHHGQSRMGLTLSDSELALADNCSLSELGVSLETCPVIKQESGNLCAISEGDLVSQCPESSLVDCDDNDDFQPVSIIGALGLSKKGALVTMYRCPQPGCPSTFDMRQKLKMHLLNHTEDQRPFKCTFEGCGWAFTTSYKLKRHLQSHDKVRPHKCEWEGCGRCFTTVYNLKAHVKQHDQENAFVCEICSERFRSATRLTNHQRAHFEPERPHKCEFPGCEKNFITYSALFSHNRTHFRETGQFICTYPGCDKRYDKACRIKIHMRSHTGERPFVCDSEACGWSFTSMSKLLRHKRKHDDDRRFTCPEEGCGKSFTRAEHLKGHSITHLGTKPFECHVDGCSAKFSARSSLYIHSKKHKQDAGSLRTHCPVANCSKHFSSCSSLKSHMLKHHHLNPDVLSQLEVTPTLTPSNELVSASTTTGTGEQLAHLDLSSLFSAVPGGPVPVGGTGPVGAFAMDLSLVSSGILAIDPASVGSALCTSGHGVTVAKASLEPLILAAGEDMVGRVLPPRGTFHLDDVQTVTPEALGSLTVLTMQAASSSADHHILSSSSALSPSTLAVPPGPELLSSPSKVAKAGGSKGGSRPRLDCVEVLGQQERDKVLTQFTGHGGGSTLSPQMDSVLSHISAYSFLESSGSARTDYRAIQLAKKRKQSGPTCSASSGLCQRKSKGGKASSTAAPMVPTSTRFVEGSAAANGGLTIHDPVTGAQYVQIQLLQDDPASEGDLSFQLSSQPSSSHSQLTVDLPVNILQEPPNMTEDDNSSDNSQFTGSTINLQDLE
uniref:Si:dkey-156n14.3 n=1 Tax=Hucho hucho TaxID=62062 RepID=A0A4W5P0K8_9TELE